jgi:hypothetical protein
MTGGTFVCDCGTRLRIFTDGKEGSAVSCPNPTCVTRHAVSGHIREVQVERDGQWVSYWKAEGPENAA